MEPWLGLIMAPLVHRDVYVVRNWRLVYSHSRPASQTVENHEQRPDSDDTVSSGGQLLFVSRCDTDKEVVRYLDWIIAVNIQPRFSPYIRCPMRATTWLKMDGSAPSTRRERQELLWCITETAGLSLPVSGSLGHRLPTIRSTRVDRIAVYISVTSQTSSESQCEQLVPNNRPPS